MSPENYRRSIEHFSEKPPGDLRVHYLLASLWAQVASIGAKNPVSHLDIAPWLDPKTQHLTPGQRRMKTHIRNTVLPQLAKRNG